MEIGVSGPFGAGLGCFTLNAHSPNALPRTLLGELMESPYCVAGVFAKHFSEHYDEYARERNIYGELKRLAQVPSKTCMPCESRSRVVSTMKW